MTVMFGKNADQGLRTQAMKQLKKRRDLATHVLVYLLVNGFLVAIWAVTSEAFFWPVFVIGPWGIGLVMNVWDVWRGAEFSDEQISREMGRLRSKRR